jgi:hypothetical protein
LGELRDPGQIKHIEEVRDGKNPFFKINLTGLVALNPTNEFELMALPPVSCHCF